MYIKEEFSNFYNNYGTKLFEAASAVLPKDISERLKTYLKNTDFLSELTKQVKTIKDGQQLTLSLDKSKFGILDQDDIIVYADKSNPVKPKFQIWIKNEAAMLDGINFSVAANLINDAVEGVGTWEENIAAVGGALTAIAMTRGADSATYFKELDKVYTKSYSESLKAALDGDLDGADYWTASFLFNVEKKDAIINAYNAIASTNSQISFANIFGKSLWDTLTTSDFVKSTLAILKDINIKNKESISALAIQIKKFKGKGTFGYLLATMFLTMSPTLIQKLDIEYKKLDDKGLVGLLKETDEDQLMALAYLIGITGDGNDDFKTEDNIGTIADIANKILGKTTEVKS